MTEVKVLGTGCAGCVALYEAAVKAVEELGLDARVVKEQDIMKIMDYNVMGLPALVVNEQVVSAGKRLSLSEVKALLKG